MQRLDGQLADLGARGDDEHDRERDPADLVSSDDLDPAVSTQLQTLDILGTMKSWSEATAGTGLAMNTGCSPSAAE